MSHEIEGINLKGLCNRANSELHLDNALNTLEMKPKTFLWKHPNMKLLGFDPRPLALGLKEDKTNAFKSVSLNTPTSHRTLCFDIRDNFGDAKYVIKGIELTPNKFIGVDALANTNYVHKIRFGSIRSAGEAGQESISAASADIGGFTELAKTNHQILFDFNGPIWQPITVINTGKKMVEGDSVWINNEWTYLSFAQFAVIDIRRFPYTHFRIEDISFDSAKSVGEIEIAKLGKLWNLPDRKQIYLRAIKRWSQAGKMFIDSEIRHCQVFDINRNKKTGLEYAWINPNNIALDGSTGDLDCTRKNVDYWNDKNRGRLEVVGGFLLYLYGIQKIDNNLLKNDQFLNSAIDIFLKTLGDNIAQKIKLEHDFLQISQFCRNSRMLYNLGTPDYEFMPGRSPFEKNVNKIEILPFMEKMGLNINNLIH